jgi:small subunit ribosomal protein S13
MASGKKVKDVEKVKEEPKKEEKKEEKKRPEVRRDIPTLIIRVAGTDLDGEKPVMHALRKIKGIGIAMSKAICIGAKVNPLTKLGSLDETQVSNLENVIKNPLNFGVPQFMVNRRRDMSTGTDMHLTSSDLDISKRFDVQRYVDLKTYKGWRHMLGQPVRGQETRSSFRVTGMAVGVMKKAILQKAAPAGAAAPAATTGAAPAPAAKPVEAKPVKK